MKVLNLVDHLQHGGVQRMAVNVANSLDQFGVDSHLCSIIEKGELSSLVSNSVKFFSLDAPNIFSLSAAADLRSYCKFNEIDIVHVHHRSLFLAFQSFVFNSRVKLIWHDHYGRQEFRSRPWLVYYLLTRRVDGVISVSHALKDWSVNSMRLSAERVRFIPNYVESTKISSKTSQIHLPGMPGFRIVCVANFRPHKDHFTLLRGLKKLLQNEPQAHLILVGKIENVEYFQNLKSMITEMSLSNNVTNLGERMDVGSILYESDVGVLSSSSEGLPLTLIEYGAASLPVVCTSVGDCPWLIKDHERGLLFQPGSPDELAEKLSKLLNDNHLRKYLGENLNHFVEENLNQNEILQQIMDFYKETLQT